MIKHPFLLVTALCASLSASLNVSAQNHVFRSINENGTVEFSDRGDAKLSSKFQISKPVVVRRHPDLSETDSLTKAQNDAPLTELDSASKGAYTDLQILSPGHNESSWISGDVQVKLALTPRLKAGHEVVIELDGSEVSASAQLDHALPEVYRGQHTLLVSVRDKATGSILATSTVDFQIHRRTDKSNSRMLHPSLKPKVVTNPSDINVILAK